MTENFKNSGEFANWLRTTFSKQLSMKDITKIVDEVDELIQYKIDYYTTPAY